jgi:hypothetical protein
VTKIEIQEKKEKREEKIPRTAIEIFRRRKIKGKQEKRNNNN